MNESEFHERASALFLRALELPDDERDALLETECRDDPALLSEVRSLLDNDVADDGAFTPALGDAFRVTPSMVDLGGEASLAPPPLPERIGDYEVTGLIGAGGMGIVYRARQSVTDREVALKVVRPELGSSRVVRRLAHEAQVLAHLQHEGVARVFDAGVYETAAGAQPFFVMELIEGTSLVDYARDKDLSLGARLELFARLCDAVQHAHQKGVVHRDLKPVNVLVTEAGDPKVLDFGVARAVDADLSISTLQTEVGQIVGTVPYMSPEQVSGDASRIDSRSDVYALGVMLYELLANRLPYDLSGATLPEAARVIRDETPTRLSTVRREYRGDLDTIVGKALEKEPERRYGSALALAEDVRRYLRVEPIAARPPSAVYQLGKFARRNRALVAAIALVFVSLVAGIIGTSMGLVRAIAARADAEESAQDASKAQAEAEASARRAVAAKAEAEENERRAEAARAEAQANEQRAESELVKAERATGFLRQLLAGSSPWMAAGRDTELLRALLDDAAKGIDNALSEYPEAEVVVRVTIGETYRMLGETDVAARHLERAFELGRANLAPDDESLLEVRRHLARVRVDQADPEAAVTLLEENLARRPVVTDALLPEAIADLGALFVAFEDLYRWIEVVERSEDVLPAAVAELGLEHSDVRFLQTRRARALVQLGRLDEAGTLYRELLDALVARLGDDHPKTLPMIWGLASVLRKSGRPLEAQPLYERHLAACIALFGSRHQETVASKNSLALLLRDLGRYDEAITLLREVVEINREDLGEQHAGTLVPMYNLAHALASAGRTEEAGRVLSERVEIHRRHFGPGDEQTLLAEINLAVQQALAGEYDTAFGHYADAIATARATEGFDRSFLGYFLMLQGQTMIAAERYAEAEESLLESWGLLVETFTTENPNTQTAARLLVEAYAGLGLGEEEARWRATAVEIGAIASPSASAVAGSSDVESGEVDDAGADER